MTTYLNLRKSRGFIFVLKRNVFDLKSILVKPTGTATATIANKNLKFMMSESGVLCKLLATNMILKLLYLRLPHYGSVRDFY